MEKFSNQQLTATGENRAFVDLQKIETLWFNTGTACNLNCPNCYIESSPNNDRIEFITKDQVAKYLLELESHNHNSKIGLTGGEPFVNPQIIEIMAEILSRGYELTILTNAHIPFQNAKNKILELRGKYKKMITFRVSLDSVEEKIHESYRGKGSFIIAVESIKWLHKNSINFSIAGRNAHKTDLKQLSSDYNLFLNSIGVDVDFIKSNRLIIFPEMSSDITIPEITVNCWGILNKSPSSMMCASERMIVKHKDELTPSVMPCTLLAYDKEFNLGEHLSSSKKRVYLNHRFCAQFCVLGRASCSSTD